MYNNDEQFDELIESHLSTKADEHIRELDHKMESVLDSEPVTPKRRRAVVGKTPAFRLALSHAVIAIAFFGIGFYLQQANMLDFSDMGDQSLSTTNTASDTSSIELKSQPFGLPMAEEADRPALGDFGTAKQLELSEVEALAESYQGRLKDSFNSEKDEVRSNSAATATNQDDSDAEMTAGAAVADTAANEAPESVISLTTDRATLLSQRIAQYLGIYAEQQDGYIYALTETSLMRLRMEHAEVLVDDLQAPAGWGFDDDGKILVVDQRGLNPIVLQLERNRALDEESEQ